MDPVSVGLLDSGVDAELGSHLDASRGFTLNEHGEVREQAVEDDELGHGTALCKIILRIAPHTRVLSAKVFSCSASTAPAVIGAGLDWLVSKDVDIVNMSFGLRRDRRVLREACARASQDGRLLIAAAPARGQSVYPSSYPGVLKVTGDARCRPDQISHLATEQARFGACPTDIEAAGVASLAGGASFAVAHVTGLLAGYLQAGGAAEGAATYLETIASYHGPERRSPTQ